MKNVLKRIFSRDDKGKVVGKNDRIQADEIRQRKEKIIRSVGERYGRAITRLSDT